MLKATVPERVGLKPTEYGFKDWHPNYSDVNKPGKEGSGLPSS